MPLIACSIGVLTRKRARDGAWNLEPAGAGPAVVPRPLGPCLHRGKWPVRPSYRDAIAISDRNPISTSAGAKTTTTCGDPYCGVVTRRSSRNHIAALSGLPRLDIRLDNFCKTVIAFRQLTASPLFPIPSRSSSTKQPPPQHHHQTATMDYVQQRVAQAVSSTEASTKSVLPFPKENKEKKKITN